MNSSDWVLDTNGELPTVESLRAELFFSVKDPQILKLSQI